VPKAGPRATPLVLGAVIVALGVWLLRARDNPTAAPPSAGVTAAFRQPQKVVSETVALKEGTWHRYSFALNSDARVQVKVYATPKAVDVLVMDDDGRANFEAAMKSGDGGKYTLVQALSSKGVLNFDQTAALSAGSWNVVVMRPQEALLFGKETKAAVRVTVY